MKLVEKVRKNDRLRNTDIVEMLKDKKLLSADDVKKHKTKKGKKHGSSKGK